MENTMWHGVWVRGEGGEESYSGAVCRGGKDVCVCVERGRKVGLTEKVGRWRSLL